MTKLDKQRQANGLPPMKMLKRGQRRQATETELATLARMVRDGCLVVFDEATSTLSDASDVSVNGGAAQIWVPK
jgi:hypothetical protein